jgi:hypothetical protein
MINLRLAAASCSFLEVLSSVTQPAAACSVGSKCNYSSSAAQQQQPGQQHKRVPDGPGLQDFIRASSPLGTSFASQSSSSNTSSNTSSHGPAHEPGASLSKSVFIETYGELQL